VRPEPWSTTQTVQQPLSAVRALPPSAPAPPSPLPSIPPRPASISIAAPSDNLDTASAASADARHTPRGMESPARADTSMPATPASSTPASSTAANGAPPQDRAETRTRQAPNGDRTKSAKKRDISSPYLSRACWHDNTGCNLTSSRPTAACKCRPHACPHARYNALRSKLAQRPLESFGGRRGFRLHEGSIAPHGAQQALSRCTAATGALTGPRPLRGADHSQVTFAKGGRGLGSALLVRGLREER
jgi:hypothetical protein